VTDLSAVNRTVTLPNRRITADYVVEALRDAIQSGRLDDGAVLTQVAVAEHFGISRPPVREAMRQLRAEGLIESQAHQAAVVRGIPLARIAELYDYRALVEGHLVLRATPSVTPALLDELWGIEEEMRVGRDRRAWLALNARLHFTLLRAAGDPTGLELVGQLQARVERYAHLWSGWAGHHQPAEHEQILECVAAGDADGARVAIEEHIRNRGARLVELGAAARRARGEAA
jgi:DNA-binding GntR family transcriptional regulator